MATSRPRGSLLNFWRNSPDPGAASAGLWLPAAVLLTFRRGGTNHHTAHTRERLLCCAFCCFALCVELGTHLVEVVGAEGHDVLGDGGAGHGEEGESLEHLLGAGGAREGEGERKVSWQTNKDEDVVFGLRERALRRNSRQEVVRTGKAKKKGAGQATTKAKRWGIWMHLGAQCSRKTRATKN